MSLMVISRKRCFRKHVLGSVCKRDSVSGSWWQKAHARPVATVDTLRGFTKGSVGKQKRVTINPQSKPAD